MPPISCSEFSSGNSSREFVDEHVMIAGVQAEDCLQIFLTLIILDALGVKKYFGIRCGRYAKGYREKVFYVLRNFVEYRC